VKPKSVKDLFRRLPEKFDPEAAEGLTAIYQFDLSGPQGGQYHLVIDDGTCAVNEGIHPDAHVTISVSGDDCLSILGGQLEGEAVFMSGRLRVSGDLGLAMQLKALFPSIS
jgi:putative sterol carrier protein